MDTQPPKRLTLEDCKIDWKNYHTTDNKGNPIVVDNTDMREEWLLDDCECDEYLLADSEICYKYYSFDFYSDKFEQWMRQENLNKSTIAYWGLINMFNAGWIKSPTFVDWKDIGIIYNFKVIQNFINEIFLLDTRINILKHFINNADFLYGKNRKKEILPSLKNLLNIQQEALKLQKETLKQQEKAEKAKNKKTKEKPEYILSLDEIVKYVLDENPDSAHVIRAMLRFFAMEKQGWATTTVKSKIDQIKQQIIVQQTNINAPISNFAQEQHIDNLTTK